MTKTLVGIRANLIVTIVLLLLAPCTAIYADTIRLRNIEEDVEGKIIELTKDYIGVSFSKKDIKAVTFLPGDRQTYTDLVTLYKGGVKLKCKVASVNPVNVVIWIPKTDVVSVYMVFTPEISRGKEQVLPPLYPSPSRVEAPTPAPDLPRDSWVDRRTVEPPISREEAKEKIKMEVMRELGTEQMEREEEVWQSPQVFKDEIKREIREEFEAQRESKERVFQETQLGRVEGRMLRKSLPLSDCEVKIVMLVKSKIPFSDTFYPKDLPTEYDGITDSEGRYHLINVAPGEYKIYWKPPTETGWIRRLDMKPDVIVESGKTTYPKDIETFKRVLN